MAVTSIRAIITPMMSSSHPHVLTFRGHGEGSICLPGDTDPYLLSMIMPTQIDTLCHTSCNRLMATSVLWHGMRAKAEVRFFFATRTPSMMEHQEKSYTGGVPKIY